VFAEVDDGVDGSRERGGEVGEAKEEGSFGRMIVGENDVAKRLTGAAESDGLGGVGSADGDFEEIGRRGNRGGVKRDGRIEWSVGRERRGEWGETAVEPHLKRFGEVAIDLGVVCDQFVAERGLGEQRVFDVAAGDGLEDERGRGGPVVGPEGAPCVGDDGVAGVEGVFEIRPRDEAGKEVGVDEAGGRETLGEQVGLGEVAPHEKAFVGRTVALEQGGEFEVTRVVARFGFRKSDDGAAQCVTDDDEKQQCESETERGRGAGASDVVESAGEQPAGGEAEARHELDRVMAEIASAQCARNHTGNNPAEDEPGERGNGFGAIGQ
jgi:hypothetical protein